MTDTAKPAGTVDAATIIAQALRSMRSENVDIAAFRILTYLAKSGRQVVPREPTEAMCRAGMDHSWDAGGRADEAGADDGFTLRPIYRAMISAAEAGE